MKKGIFRFLRAIVFCALLIVSIAAVSVVLERKESREKLAPFFERADQIDVLFFGSSHVLNGIYPMELWNDYGITAYNFGSYNNTISVSYWMLRSALDVCEPKLVVIDIDEIDRYNKVGDNSSDVHTAIDGLPLSLTKLEAIADLMSDSEVIDNDGKRYSDLRLEFCFPLSLYHPRWEYLTEDDLHPQNNSQLGASMGTNVAQPDDYAIISDAVEESGWGFVYLRKIIEECKSRDIEVLLINVPFPPVDGDKQRYANRVYYLAEECGVEFIDFVFMDQIVDYSTDCHDAASHLNASGARKVTDYLGQLMVDVYGIEDHRSDAFSTAWNSDYDGYVKIKLQQLREQLDLSSFMMLLHDSSFSAIISVPQDSPLYQSDNLIQVLQNIGRRHLFEEDTYDFIWADSLFPLEELDDARVQGAAYLTIIDRNADRIVEIVGSADDVIETSFGQVTYRADESDVFLSVANGDSQRDCFDSSGDESQVQIAVIDNCTGNVVLVRKTSVNLRQDEEL